MERGKPSHAVLDAVEDFCDFVHGINEQATAYREKSGKSGQEVFFQKKFGKKYTFDWQKDALNYHAGVKSFVQKERDKTNGSFFD